MKRGAAANYSLLTNDAIIAMDVQSVAADDAVLALWVPSSLLDEGLRTMRAWGCVQKQIYTWTKMTKSGEGLAFGMGHIFRGCTEHALIGKRGRPKILSRSQRNVELTPATPHSVKPPTLQDRLETMVCGPRLELFARRVRENWTCVGNECPSEWLGVDIRDALKTLAERPEIALKESA